MSDPANQALGENLEEHPKFANYFTLEIRGRTGKKNLEVLKGTGYGFKIFHSKLC